MKQSVRCSVVGLAAEVRLCKTVTQKTGGMYCMYRGGRAYTADLVLAGPTNMSS